MVDVTSAHISLAKANHVAKPNVTELEKCNFTGSDSSLETTIQYIMTSYIASNRLFSSQILVF